MTKEVRLFGCSRPPSDGQLRIGSDEPELSTPCGKGRKGGGNGQRETDLGEEDFALLRTGGLTPIMLAGKCIYCTCHPTGNIHQESRIQTGAPRRGSRATAANICCEFGMGGWSPTRRCIAAIVAANAADSRRGRARERSLRSRGRRALARRKAGRRMPAVARPAKFAAAGRRDP